MYSIRAAFMPNWYQTKCPIGKTFFLRKVIIVHTVLIMCCFADAIFSQVMLNFKLLSLFNKTFHSAKLCIRDLRC